MVLLDHCVRLRHVTDIIRYMVSYIMDGGLHCLCISIKHNNTLTNWTSTLYHRKWRLTGFEIKFYVYSKFLQEISSFSFSLSINNHFYNFSCLDLFLEIIVLWCQILSHLASDNATEISLLVLKDIVMTLISYTLWTFKIKYDITNDIYDAYDMNWHSFCSKM